MTSLDVETALNPHIPIPMDTIDELILVIGRNKNGYYVVADGTQIIADTNGAIATFQVEVAANRFVVDQEAKKDEA